MELGEAQTAEAFCILRSDRPAIHRTQEEVQEALSGCGIVKDITDQRCFSGLVDEVSQAFRCRLERFEEKRIYGSISRGELGRVQVPALIEGMPQGVPNLVIVQLPGSVHDHLVFRKLLMRQAFRSMRRNG